MFLFEISSVEYLQKRSFHQNLILQQSMYTDDKQLHSSNETIEDSAR